MRKSLLILNRSQFGYHSDTYYYCKYLRDRYDITYIGYDFDRPRLELEGVRIVYVPRNSPKPLRYAKFIATAVSHLRESFDFCFVRYFPGCSVLKLASSPGEFIFDIRTADIRPQAIARTFADTLLRIEAGLFRNITVISKSLSDRLGLPASRTHVLPLGAVLISETTKRFDTLRLLYVGTLSQRNLHQTIHGLDRFRQITGGELECSYRIIGSGWGSEERDLRALVKILGLDPVIEVTGPIPHDQLSKYFEEANVGVSYIPMTDYYDVQPPTKTFEYLLSGMAVIATDTYENRRVLEPSNGVLIQDSAEDFCSGLQALAGTLSTFDSQSIRAAAEPYLWRNIIETNLVPYLESL